MARIFKRYIGTITYASNTIQRLELPRNHVFKGLFLRLTMSYTASAGTTSTDENPYGILKQIRILRNGSEVLQSIDGGTAYLLSKYNRTTTPRAIPAGTGAQAAQLISADIPIDFASLGFFNPALTLYRAVGTSSSTIEITFGDQTNFMVGSVLTGAGLTGQVDVFGEELIDLAGNFGDKELKVIERAVTATQTELPIDLPTGDMYRRIFIKGTFGASSPDNFYQTIANPVINSVTVKSDGILAHFDKVTFQALLGLNKQQQALEAAFAGFVCVDFCEDGNPKGMIDTSGSSSFQLILDVTTQTGAKVRVIPETLSASLAKELAA